MAKRVAQLAVASVEFVGAGAQHSGACGNRPVEPEIGILDIQHDGDGGACAQRIGRDRADLGFVLGIFVGEIENSAIDPQRRMANLALMHIALKLFGFEGVLVKGNGFGAAPDAEIRRDDGFWRAHTVSPSCNPVGWL